MKSFFALVTPFDPSLKPDQGLPTPQPPTGGGKPPEIDNTLPGNLPRPEHPIYYPLPPDILPPFIDNTLPGSQPGIDNTLPGDQPFPSHPIYLPPGNGGWLPVYIDNTLPGSQPGIDNTLPGAQPGIDNTLPIPPDMPVPPEIGFSGTIKFKAIWTPANGWQTIGVIIPGDKPIPTPSKKR